MKRKRFNVKVKTGFDDISFGFEHMGDAMKFAQTAMESAIPYVSSDGTENEVTITVSMNDIEIKKEEESNELAVQA